MIAFGSYITSNEVFESCARVGIRNYGDPDAVVAEGRDYDSAPKAYNEMLDHFSKLNDLEAAVFVAQEAEIADPDFGAKIRATFAEDRVAIAGVVGADAPAGVKWWEADPVGGYRTMGSSVAFRDMGKLALAASVTGPFLALSPWAAKNLRFDEELPLVGYDLDICYRARKEGKLMVVLALELVVHSESSPVPTEGVEAADKVFAAKWPDGVPELPPFEEAKSSGNGTPPLGGLS